MSFEAMTSFLEQNGTTIDPGKPAGTNDATKLLVAVLANDRFDPGVSGFTAPSGWNPIAGFSPNDLGIINLGALTFFWALGSVASTTFTRNGTSGNNNMVGAVLRFGGRNLVAPVTDADRVTADTVTITIPSVAAALGDDGIWCWVNVQDPQAWGAFPGDLTDRGQNAGTVFRMAIATKENMAAGAVGTKACTHPDNFSGKGGVSVLLAQSGGSVIIPMGKRIFVNA